MIKFIFICLICSFVCVLLREIKSEFYFIALTISGIIILYFIFTYVGQVLSQMEDIINNSGIDSNILKIILKITSVGYIVEFSTNLVEDMGLKSISDKIVLMGKIIILITSMPILISTMNLFQGMLK